MMEDGSEGDARWRMHGRPSEIYIPWSTTVRYCHRASLCARYLSPTYQLSIYYVSIVVQNYPRP